MSLKKSNIIEYRIQNDGFTIMEILVGINLSFIVIAIIVSLFLFATKFVASSVKNIDDKTLSLIHINAINSHLSNSSFFTVEIENKQTKITIDKKFEISFNIDGINLTKNDSLTFQTDYEIFILLKNGDEKIIKNGKIESVSFFTDDTPDIHKSEIKELILNFASNSKKYTLTYKPESFSINHFKNVVSIDD